MNGETYGSSEGPRRCELAVQTPPSVKNDPKQATDQTNVLYPQRSLRVKENERSSWTDTRLTTNVVRQDLQKREMPKDLLVADEMQGGIASTTMHMSSTW